MENKVWVQEGAPVLSHVGTHTHTLTHSHTHTLTYTSTFSYIHTLIHTHRLTYTNTLLYTLTHTYTRHGAYWVCDITAVSLWGRGKGISLYQVLIKL